MSKTNPFSLLNKLEVNFFFPYNLFGIFVFFASAAPQRPTCSYHANPAGSPTRNDMPMPIPGFAVWCTTIEPPQSL